MSQWLAKNAAELGGSSKPKPASALRKTWLAKKIMVHDDGRLSPATIKRLQAQVNVTIDGALGPVTRMAVQQWLGVSADGQWGPKTSSALQKKVGATKTTGHWSPWLGRALQRWLNEHGSRRDPRRLVHLPTRA